MNGIFLAEMVLCLLSALWMVRAAWFTTRKKPDELHYLVLTFTFFYALVYLWGVLYRIVHGAVAVDELTVNMVEKVINQQIKFDDVKTVVYTCLTLLYLLAIPFHLILAKIIRHDKSVLLRMLLATVLAFTAVSIVVSFTPWGFSVFANFFYLCCGAMAAFAWVLGFTYKQFCTLGNNYIQGAICVIAALIPVILILRRAKQTKWNILRGVFATYSVANLLIHGWLFCWMCTRYLFMPLESAFDLCVEDLKQLGNASGFTYVQVCLILYVILFCADIVYNIVLYFVAKSIFSSSAGKTIEEIPIASIDPVKQRRERYFKLLLYAVALFAILGMGYVFYSYFVPRKTNPHSYATIGAIPTPLGYTRMHPDDGGYADYLRTLPLKERGSKVLLYTGGEANFQQLAYAVVNMNQLSNDEQCADVCIRLRAEYLFAKGRYSDIRFHSVGGQVIPYTGGASRTAFNQYLRRIYGVASTTSLSRYATPRELKDLQPGDVFVYGAHDHAIGSKEMGHAMMVVDVAENCFGQKAFLLAEGNTPARNIHLLRNFYNPFSSPWFYLNKHAKVLLLDMFYYKNTELRAF